MHRLLLAAAALFCLTSSLPAQGPVAVTVDLAQPTGPYTPIYNWFGYDEGNYTTAPNGQHLLRQLHDLSPVPVYIRAHHLLTSGDGTPELKWSSTGVYSEDSNGKPVYNFQILDGIFDAYKAAGVRPMVELGFMPKDLAATLPNRHEPYQVHYPASTVSGASNNPPKDYPKWGELVRVVTAHLVERYGRETVLTWPFEVWNEPDIDYWHTSPQEYFRLYDFAAAGVRSALPGALVGGPASTGPAARNGNAFRFLQTFLQHVASGPNLAQPGQPIPLDFISFHVKGFPRITEGHVHMGLTHELTDADHGFEIVSSYPQFQHLPIILSEADPEGCAACSSKINPANNYRNGTLYPAYTAAAYKSLLDLAQLHHVNLISMLSWSFEFEGKDYFEGFRSLSTNGVDKPILNLFRMLGLMSGSRVLTTSTGQIPLASLAAEGTPTTPDIDALATVAPDHHTASILLWNYHDDAEPAPASLATVTVRGLPTTLHRVLLTPFRIDDQHSNAYTVWQALGSPQHPTPDQLATLHSREGLDLLTSPTWLTVSNGQITIPADLPRQSISLLQLTW